MYLFCRLKKKSKECVWEAANELNYGFGRRPEPGIAQGCAAPRADQGPEYDSESCFRLRGVERWNAYQPCIWLFLPFWLSVKLSGPVATASPRIASTRE